jgi:hypothetical protein
LLQIAFNLSCQVAPVWGKHTNGWGNMSQHKYTLSKALYGVEWPIGTAISLWVINATSLCSSLHMDWHLEQRELDLICCWVGFIKVCTEWYGLQRRREGEHLRPFYYSHPHSSENQNGHWKALKHRFLNTFILNEPGPRTLASWLDSTPSSGHQLFCYLKDHRHLMNFLFSFLIVVLVVGIL